MCLHWPNAKTPLELLSESMGKQEKDIHSPSHYREREGGRKRDGGRERVRIKREGGGAAG